MGAQEPCTDQLSTPPQPRWSEPNAVSMQERVISLLCKQLSFPGKQARCQKLYPDGEEKRGEEAEGEGEGTKEENRIIREKKKNER